MIETILALFVLAGAAAIFIYGFVKVMEHLG